MLLLRGTRYAMQNALVSNSFPKFIMFILTKLNILSRLTPAKEYERVCWVALGTDLAQVLAGIFMRLYMRPWQIYRFVMIYYMMCTWPDISTGYCAWWLSTDLAFDCAWRFLRDIRSSSCRSINGVPTEAIWTWCVLVPLWWQHGTFIWWSRATKRRKISCALTSWDGSTTSPALIHHGLRWGMLMLLLKTCGGTEWWCRAGCRHEGIKTRCIEFRFGTHGTVATGRWHSFERETAHLVGKRIHRVDYE